jgi:hypothetical protein
MESGAKRKNYMRQYYDVYCLLGQASIQEFVASAEYAQHKAKWIKGKDAEFPVNRHPALNLEDKEMVADFTNRYESTSN